jgi:hypothetical protein
MEQWFEARRKTIRYSLLLVAGILTVIGKLSPQILWSLSASLFWATLFVERLHLGSFSLVFMVLLAVHIMLGSDFTSKSNIAALLVTCVSELYKEIFRLKGYRIE